MGGGGGEVNSTYLLTYFFGLRFFSSEVEIFSGRGGGWEIFGGGGIENFFFGGGVEKFSGEGVVENFGGRGWEIFEGGWEISGGGR